MTLRAMPRLLQAMLGHFDTNGRATRTALNRIAARKTGSVSWLFGVLQQGLAARLQTSSVLHAVRALCLDLRLAWT